MLRTDATMKPIACATSGSPIKAIASPTSAPSEKKSKKKETERSSPAKARAASAAQKIMSRFSKLRFLDINSIPAPAETAASSKKQCLEPPEHVPYQEPDECREAVPIRPLPPLAGPSEAPRTLRGTRRTSASAP